MKKRLLFYVFPLFFVNTFSQNLCLEKLKRDTLPLLIGGMVPLQLDAVADFNNDGFKDIAWWGQHTPNAGGGTVYTYTITGIFSGDGTGHFAEDTSWGGNAMMKIVSGDYNEDGDEDMIFLNHTGAELHLNDGTGHFSTTSLGLTGMTWTDCATADFNGDQHLDILVSNNDYVGFPNIYGKTLLIPGNGGGSFGTPVVFSSMGINNFNIFVADFNHDGLPDAVSGKNLMINNGGGNFTILSVSLPQALFSVLDLNEDGNPDLIGKDSIYFGSGYSNFLVKASLGIPAGFKSARRLGDMDMDGHADLLLLKGNGTIDTLVVLSGNGDATFSQAGVILPLDTAPGFPMPFVDCVSIGPVSDYDGNGANDVMMCFSYVDFETFTSFLVPVMNRSAFINSSSSSFCSGDSLQLTCTTSGQTLWSTGATTSSVYVSAPGTYSVTHTDIGGCVSTDSIVVNSIGATTFASLNAGNPLCFYQAPLQLTTGVPVGGVYSGPGVSNGYFNPQQAGTGLHTLTYTYAGPGGCTGTATTQVQVDMCVGMHEQEKNSFIKIYPNPGKRNFVLDIASTEFSLAVYDIFGKEIYQNKNQKTIQLPELSAGIYLFRVVADGKNFTERVIIE